MHETELRSAAQRWLAEDPDPRTRDELEALLREGDLAELRERFASRLEFGTAGLRGVLGAGPNRMNRLVVIRTTAGLARYLLETLPDVKRRGVVVGYDGRTLSSEASRDTAEILAGHGIPVHLFSETVPTPLVAFAVRRLDTAGGVMITASHNPPEYNGYKVYWENGAQIIPPHDVGISQAIDEVGSTASIPRIGLEEARAQGLLHEVGGELFDAYREAVRGLSVTSDGKERISLVYTPLHGVGGAMALRLLREHGFSSVQAVAEQLEPDPLFPTVRFPNPEEPGALDLAMRLATESEADLILANDPDADRLAVAVRREDSSYRMLSGNEIGALLAAYLLENDPLGGDRLLIGTIVSTPLVGDIASAYGARYDEVLTGFKWVANRAMELEQKTGSRFILGFEEALGYSVGTVCRDKDGVSAAVIFAELAAHAAARGRGVMDELEAIWRRFGLYLSHQESITREGPEGKVQIDRTMELLRARPPERIGSRRVRRLRDLEQGFELEVDSGARTPLELPRSNVLVYFLDDGSRVIARPSGTEPKIKYYFDLKVPVAESSDIDTAWTEGSAVLRGLVQDFLATLPRT